MSFPAARRTRKLKKSLTAREPITVFCLAGKGVFRAGANLEDEQNLTAGTLITLDADIEHEVAAAPDVFIISDEI